MSNQFNGLPIGDGGLRYTDIPISEEEAKRLQSGLPDDPSKRGSIFEMAALGAAVTTLAFSEPKPITSIRPEIQTTAEEDDTRDRPTLFNETLAKLDENGVWYTEDIEIQAYALRRNAMGGIEDKFKSELETLYTRDYASQIMLKVMRDRKRGETAKIQEWGEKQDAWKLAEFAIASATYVEELMKIFFEEDFELCKLEAASEGKTVDHSMKIRNLRIFPSKNVGVGNKPDINNIQFTEEGKKAILLKLLDDPQTSDGRVAFTAWILGVVSSDELGIGFNRCTENILRSRNAESFLTGRKPSQIPVSENGRVSWHSIANVHDNKGEEISLDGVIHSYNEPNWKDENWRQAVIQKIQNPKTKKDE